MINGARKYKIMESAFTCRNGEMMLFAFLYLSLPLLGMIGIHYIFLFKLFRHELLRYVSICTYDFVISHSSKIDIYRNLRLVQLC